MVDNFSYKDTYRSRLLSSDEYSNTLPFSQGSAGGGGVSKMRNRKSTK